MEKGTKIIIGVVTGVAIGATVYLTFIHKYKDGLTGWQKLSKPKTKQSDPRPIADKTEQSEGRPISGGPKGGAAKSQVV